MAGFGCPPRAFTFSAFPSGSNGDGDLTPELNSDPAVPKCGSGVLDDVCLAVTPPAGKTLDGIFEHLGTALAAGPEGPYNNVGNNSNLWVKRRIEELQVNVSLPLSAPASKPQALANLLPAIARLTANLAEAGVDRAEEIAERVVLKFCETLGLGSDCKF
jgi:hypothetical protein